jgi:DNA-binding transcriptional LysR family regulator
MRAVELRHIRCFVSVARHLHFARAAEELGIAPPALTKQIQEAERLLGVRLFHRTKRSVALSAAGEAYLAEALAALDHLARGAELAELAERGELGRIAVGYVGSAVFSGVLQNTVRGFRAIHPRIEVGIREVVMSEVGAMLDDGRIDVAYVRPPIRLPEGVQVRTVHRDTFILALPADSPLAVAQAVSPAQLRDESFVLPEQEYGTQEVARRGRFTPGTLAAVVARVSLGGEVAVVPHSVAGCVVLPGVEYRPIAGKPILSEVALAFRRFERAPAVRAFLQHATNE